MHDALVFVQPSSIDGMIIDDLLGFSRIRQRFRPLLFDFNVSSILPLRSSSKLCLVHIAESVFPMITI